MCVCTYRATIDDEESVSSSSLTNNVLSFSVEILSSDNYTYNQMIIIHIIIRIYLRNYVCTILCGACMSTFVCMHICTYVCVYIHNMCKCTYVCVSVCVYTCVPPLAKYLQSCGDLYQSNTSVLEHYSERGSVDGGEVVYVLTPSMHVHIMYTLLARVSALCLQGLA